MTPQPYGRRDFGDAGNDRPRCDHEDQRQCGDRRPQHREQSGKDCHDTFKQQCSPTIARFHGAQRSCQAQAAIQECVPCKQKYQSGQSDPRPHERDNAQEYPNHAA